MRLMATMRFFTSLFALAAVLALAHDATPYLSGAGPFNATTLMGYWLELAPASLEATRDTIVTTTAPWVWNPVLTGILNVSAPVLFGVLAVICGYFGRRRHDLKVHIN